MLPSLEDKTGVWLGERLAAAAAAFGPRVALRDVGARTEITGAELAARIDLWRRRVEGAGLPPGAVVALLARNGADALAASLALLVTGLVPLELPAEWNAAAISQALAYAEPAAVLVGPGLEAAALGEERELWREDGWVCRLRPSVDARAEPGAVGLMFTGGTDGVLKAAVWSAAGLAHVLDEVVRYLEQDASTVTATALPWQHGYGKSVVLSSLLSGSTHCILPRGPLTDPIPVALEKAGATSFSGVPVQYRLALRGQKLDGLSRLRTACVAGGALRADELAQLGRAAPSTGVFVMYGLTEMTTRVSYLPPEELARRPGSCGAPLRGVEARLGEGGELWVRGPNRMLGYWRRPAETAAVLDGDGWLRTGDVAEIDAGGFIFLRGRSKNLIKKSGAVLYPQLLEDAARRALGRDVAAVGLPDPSGEDRLCLFVVGLEAADAPALKSAVLRTLGTAYLPDEIRALDALPLSPAGKVRLDELRRLAAQR